MAMVGEKLLLMFFCVFVGEKENFIYLQHELTESITKTKDNTKDTP